MKKPNWTQPKVARMQANHIAYAFYKAKRAGRESRLIKWLFENLKVAMPKNIVKAKAVIYYFLVLREPAHPAEKAAKDFFAGKINNELQQIMELSESRSASFQTPNISQKEDGIMAKKEETKTTRTRIECLGYPVTQILRWLGANGYTTEQARGAMSALKVPVSEGCISISVPKGRRGVVDIISLPRELAAKLKAVIPALPEPTKAKPTKALVQKAGVPVKKVAKPVKLATTPTGVKAARNLKKS
jgi:hypothetical protein